ncbi:MAG: glycosyltransferase family 2 protein [Anaerolineae bacterium]|nr:glycosyltransferase family 2 protein [Anaerolineae bacterium]MCO5186928.1 glycosyltransferase family 2 protein [Anaerolineae bacterium]MCO5192587.1 glycosyltransferase family 2 protein [Anaerolineae bacterium]MCO5199189.1 glycosyltransferase family 2 protein [Anaerolineae bacterium]MCO5203639.1 glycosyltransferase family 2 protein [Anaerolineae bacterium]
MTTLTVVIPAYNEEDGITEIVQRVLATRDALKKAQIDELELLVVDDGSKDATRDIVHAIEQQEQGVRLICHKQNRGYGAALKTGFGLARGELIGFLDADGTYPPEYFPQLCTQALNGSDIVVGSRMAGAETQMPLTRKVGNLFFATLLSIIGPQRVTDSASGMRVFKSAILERIYPLPDGLNLTPVMSTRAVHEGITISEIPIPYSERLGRSKLSVVHDGSLFLRSMLWTALTYNPVRILGIVGMLGVAVALACALWLVGIRASGVTELSSWSAAVLFFGSVSGFVGVSLFALGVTFNYLVSLFHKEPVRQGLFGKPLFKQPLEYHFGWMGLIGVLIGLGIAAVVFMLGGNQWAIGRIMLYLLGSAMLVMIGAQLVIYWVIIRVLDELSQREAQSQADMQTDEK